MKGDVPMLKVMMQRFIKDERGQGLAEYGLIIALVAVLLVGSLTLFKDGLVGVFTDITSHF